MDRGKDIVTGLLKAVIVGLQVLLFGAAGDIWILPEIATKVSQLGGMLLAAILPVGPTYAAAPVGMGGIFFLLAISISLFIHAKFGL